MRTPVYTNTVRQQKCRLGRCTYAIPKSVPASSLLLLQAIIASSSYICIPPSAGLSGATKSSSCTLNYDSKQIQEMTPSKFSSIFFIRRLRIFFMVLVLALTPNTASSPVSAITESGNREPTPLLSAAPSSKDVANSHVPTNGRPGISSAVPRHREVHDYQGKPYKWH